LNDAVINHNTVSKTTGQSMSTIFK